MHNLKLYINVISKLYLNLYSVHFIVFDYFTIKIYYFWNFRYINGCDPKRHVCYREIT
jgi:hypothetical protein